MPLSFQEKRTAQKVVTEQSRILANHPSFTVKRTAQKAKLDAMLRLGIVANIQEQSSLTQAIIAQHEPENTHTSVPLPLDSHPLVASADTGQGRPEPIGQPQVPGQEPDHQTPRQDTSHFYEFDPDRKPAQRKRENNAAMALLRQIESGEVVIPLSAGQKATLAKYSGLGGALVGIDGQKGSAYEYYTPKPIAQGIWGLAKALGFSGGKVLDPCAGVGIFGATAPDSAIVDAVELDETSGTINALVNDAPGYGTVIAPFEKVATHTPDGDYDAVVSNVPFGDNTARGDNKMHDKRYRKESLQAYFILRSLEKLRPGGLAIFIVPPSVVSGRVGKEESLRVRASYLAEFMGAYRLPNKVFGTASADTITDVIAFRKYDKATAVKIAELKSQSPDVLIAANVQWQPFVDGRYFAGEGKSFILGEFVPKDPTQFRDPDKVLTTATMGEIGGLLRKFPDSRIDWALLDATETEAIIYKDGDTVTQAGQTLQWQQGQWQAIANHSIYPPVAQSADDIKDPYNAFYKQVAWASASQIHDYMVDARLMPDMPGWFRDAFFQVSQLPLADQQKTWNAGVVGQACAQVLDERLSEETGVDYLAEYPQLSEAMQRLSSAAKAVSGKVGGDLKQGLLTIGHHYTAKGGFSALWRGDVLQAVVAAETTRDYSFDGILYRNKSAWASIADAKAIYGDGFDPLTDSHWCVSADGMNVCRADDYYTGNYAEFLKRVEADMAMATDKAVIGKLLAQKLNAGNYIDKIDVKAFSFNLFSPHVTQEEKADFMRRFVNPAAAVVYDEKTGDKRVDIDIKITKNSTDRDKLFNRFGDYLKNGTISLGGAKLGMSDAKALKALRRMVNTSNEQFNGWAQANPQIMNRLEDKANNPAILSFRQADDESPMQIPGMNPALGLHGYQNAYVRKTGRDFSGLNGFDVGLGKTFSSLAAVQYAQAIGVKTKTAFVVPNSVLSNWMKESAKAYASTEDCLFIGLHENKQGKLVVDSSMIDADLSSIMENRHRKIFMTFETFERIKLRDETIARYEAYLGGVDINYQADGDDVKGREAAKSKKAGIKAVLTEKTGAAPYLEDLGIDSIVIDEAHNFKNSSKVFNFKSAKFLSLGSQAKRGIDAQAKAWYIRGLSPRGDGILLLTATPITNSPLEIYSILSLAKGHDKVNDMFLGINGADDFMNMMTDIVNEDDVTIDGIDRTTNVFVGLNNVKTLSRAINQSSTIKSAADVGGQVALPEAEHSPATVDLTEAAVGRLQLYKDAFRWAIDDLSERKDNRGDADAYRQVADYFGESQKLIAHPFNLINKMTLLIADPELDRRATFFTIEAGNLDKAKSAIAAFNNIRIIEKRPRVSPFTQDDAVVGRKVTMDEETGDTFEQLSIEVRALLQADDKTIIIDTIDSQTQARWGEWADKAGLDLDVSIPPKLAALLENVRLERATPRGVDDEGNPSPIVKQIIFCDILALHDKIKRLLAKKAGIPAGKTAIITGKTNNTPDEIMAVQDGFNAHGADNRYEVIIANEKAEVGINLQKGTQAIHHLSIGWTPDSLTQRNGRGVRQGNKTQKVTIYTYDADGTFDAIKRGMVDKKAGWIAGVMDVNGGNKVAISGGLSKERLEALIDVTGDQDAMSKIQASIAAKDAESRAATNLDKQRVNIDTIKKQYDFIQSNDPVKDFAIPKIVNLWTVGQQITAIAARVKNPKATPLAVLKNQAILAELQAKESGLVAALNGSLIIQEGTPGSYSPVTVADVVNGYNDGYGKKRTAEDFAEKLGRTYHFDIQVIEGSPLHTEWLSEIDMAKSMIGSALGNFNEQSKQAGAMPKEVGQAFAEGRGIIHNGAPITVGSFYRHAKDILVVKSNGQLAAIHEGNDNTIGMVSMPKSAAFILPGSGDYEGCLMDAAKLEDASGKNTYSEIVPEVTQYRTTAMVKDYLIQSNHLPPPYFPIVIAESVINGDALLQSLYDRQKEMVISQSAYYFQVAYDADVQAQSSSVNFYGALFAYAKAYGAKVQWNMTYDHNLTFSMNNEIKGAFDANDREELMGLLADSSDIDATFINFVESKVNFIDFTGATISNIKALLPFNVCVAYNIAVTAAKQAKNPEEPPVAQEASSSAPEDLAESPDDIVAITGETKKWMAQIKSVASQYGDGKYKWDGRNLAWNVKRKTWDRLIHHAYPLAINDLKLIPATLRAI